MTDHLTCTRAAVNDGHRALAVGSGPILDVSPATFRIKEPGYVSDCGLCSLICARGPLPTVHSEFLVGREGVLDKGHPEHVRQGIQNELQHNVIGCASNALVFPRVTHHTVELSTTQSVELFVVDVPSNDVVDVTNADGSTVPVPTPQGGLAPNDTTQALPGTVRLFSTQWLKHQTMLIRANKLGDFLFVFQIIMALVFGLSNFVTLLTKSTEGVPVTWFGTWCLFNVLSLLLSVKAHRAKPSRSSKQTIMAYVVISIVISLDFMAVVISPSARWSGRDTISASASCAVVAIACVVAAYKQVSINDAAVRCAMAVGFKAIPQFLVAATVIEQGADGLSNLAIVAGHMTICGRIIQISYTIRVSGLERNRVGALIAEISNEVSWLTATIAVAVVRSR